MKKLYYLIAVFTSFINTDLSAQTCSTITTFPFKETFETDSPNRSCWTQQVIGGNNPSYDGWAFKKGAGGGSDYNIVNAHSGQLNACTQISPSSENAKIRLISPKMDITNLDTPTLSFFFGQEYWGVKQNILNVYYRTSATSDWKLLKAYPFNVPDWKQEILTLPERSSELQICFEGVNKYARANVLDDIVVGNSNSVESYPSTCSPSTPSNNFETGSGDLKLIYLANDFNVAAHTNLSITNIIFNTIDKGGIESFDIFLMKSNDMGLPSEVVEYYQSITPDSVTDLNVREGYTFRKNTFNLSAPVVLEGGAVGKRYWLVVKAVNKVPENPSYWEATSIRNSGKEFYYSGDGVEWKAVPNGVDGVFTLLGSCSQTNPTDSYCVPKFNFVMPIDKVKIGTIDNTSTSNSAYEDFSSVKSDLERGKNYSLQVNAKTSNSTTPQAITLFVDWNQNGFLGDEGEIYNIGKVTQANGNTITYQLPVPLSATLGSTKMRIISNFTNYATSPCDALSQGQAEDYTFVIQKESLSVSETGKDLKPVIYPNPTKNKITIKNDSKLISAEVFDLNGRKLLEIYNNEVDLSKLSTGQYLLKMNFENGKTDTQKVIKQ